AAAALEMARRGYDVALTDIDENGLQETGAAIEELDAAAKVLLLPGDLCGLDFTQSLAKSTFDHFGRVDVLINNAAWRELVTMRNISVESWEKTLRVMLTAPAFLARECAVYMERAKRGLIINISSIQAQQTSSFATPYAVAKAGLETLTFDLAGLYGAAGIRVVALALGAVDTQLSQDYADGDDMRAVSEDIIALGRWTNADEAARTIAWLASDDASYVTGTVVTADGGWRHQHMGRSLKRQMFPGEF
ncbi:MAG: SDR family oxidoreductase, partial [Abditibacteriaceae bacterium]